MAETIVLDVRGLAERWGVSLLHIHNMRKAGKLPCFNVGAGSQIRPRFRLADIEKIEAGNLKDE